MKTKPSHPSNFYKYLLYRVTMSILKIQPIQYNGKQLDEVGRGVLSAFHPLLEGFIIGPDISSDPVHRWSVRYGYHIFGPDLIEYMSQLGSFLLGVTQLYTIRKFGVWTYGQGSSTRKVAYVSSYGPEFDHLDSDTHVERLSIEAIAGHITWEEYISSRDMKFCDECYEKLGIPEPEPISDSH